MAELGLDLGALQSKVAAIGPSGEAVLVPTGDGETSLPSRVAALRNTALVGNLAEALDRSDERVVSALPVLQLRGGGDARAVRLGDRELGSLPQAALLVRRLRALGEHATAERAGCCVLAVPPEVTPSQLAQLRQACHLAGLPVLGSLTSLAAIRLAAVGYGLRGQMLVCDLGHTAFRCAVFDPEGRESGLTIQERAGGARLDSRFLDLLQRALPDEVFAGPRWDLELSELRRSLRSERGAVVSHCVASRSGLYELRLDRTALGNLVAEVRENMASAILGSLGAAGIRSTDLEGVVVVGGLSGLPGIRGAIRAVLGGTSRFFDDVHDGLAAVGAAEHARQLLARGESARLPAEFAGLAVSALGIVVADARTGVPGVDIIVPMGSAFPTSSRRSYYAAYDGQDRLDVHLIEQHPTGPSRCLATLTLDAGEGLRRGHPVEVSVVVRSDWTAVFEVYDAATGDEQKTQISLATQVEPGVLQLRDVVRDVGIEG